MANPEELLEKELEATKLELDAVRAAYNGAIYDRDRARKNVEKQHLIIEELRVRIEELKGGE